MQRSRLAAIFVSAGTIFCAATLGAQEKPATPDAAMKPGMQMTAQEQGQHQHMEMPPLKAEYPRLGRAQENASGALMTLDQMQKIASEKNPTMRQAEAEAFAEDSIV